MLFLYLACRPTRTSSFLRLSPLSHWRSTLHPGFVSPQRKHFEYWISPCFMTLLILLANIFVRILYKPPTRLIGLKSLKSSTICFLGIKTKKVAFKFLTNLLCSWNSSKKLRTSFFTKSQLKDQKAKGKPSGPEALSMLSPVTVVQISSSDKASSSLVASSYPISLSAISRKIGCQAPGA